MKKMALAITAGIIALSLGMASHASTAHIAAGHATLHDGTMLDLSASDAQSIARLYSDATNALTIQLSCIDEQTLLVPYPIPHYLNEFFASGTGSDGRAYWLTVIDETGGTDRVAISDAQGSYGACAGPKGAAEVSAGDFAIAAI